MKKTFGLIIGTAVAALVAGAAQAADLEYRSPADASGFYIRGDVGYSWLEWDGPMDDGNLTLGGGIGYRFNEFFRTDVRFTYAGGYKGDWVDWPANTRLANIKTYTVLANVYFDLPVEDWPFRPYVGAGLGWGHADCCRGGPEDDGLAMALMGGVTFALTDSVDLDLGYKYQRIFITGWDTEEHQITAGFRYNF